MLTALSWLLLNQPAQAEGNSCLSCHEPETKLFAASAHAQGGLTCVDCHGGNPRDPQITSHNTNDFRRPATKQKIAEACAACHADVRRMNPFGLPTDQLDRYKTSKHGEQLFTNNDQKVAVCTDCHGAHDILKVKSPLSRTYPTNIPQTCGRCHSDEKLMSQYKLPADVVAQFKTSYHAHLLLEKGDLSAPSCVTCHDNHGARPPGAKEVGQVCGKCHVRQRELFEKCPHAEAAKAEVFSECVSCHGNHAIQKASVELFSTTCVQCHAKDPKQLALRDTLARMIRTAQDSFASADERVHAATMRGIATEDEQLLLQEAKTQVTQLEVLQHTLSVETLRPVAARAEEITKATREGIEHSERVEHWKRLALVPICGFLAVMAVLFGVKRKQVERK